MSVPGACCHARAGHLLLRPRLLDVALAPPPVLRDALSASLLFPNLSLSFLFLPSLLFPRIKGNTRQKGQVLRPDFLGIRLSDRNMVAVYID
jgi:hypothetical protein